MSLKVKLTSLITTFILLCSLLTVGVFAVKNTSFNVGGDIVFNVQGIEATIALTDTGLQNIALPDGVTAGEDVFAPIAIDNTTSADSVASQFSKWSNLDLSFDEGKSTATIELIITNTTSDDENYIDITALADATTKNNAKIDVVNNAGGVTALVGKGESATFTITFTVIDDEYSASLNGFSVNFDMKKLAKTDIPTLSAEGTYNSMTFTAIDETTMSVSASSTDIAGVDGVLEIPAYVVSADKIYKVTKLGNFRQCTSLTSVVLPETIIDMGMASFASCTNLSSINFPKMVTELNGTFDGCGFVDLIIPETITSIPAAFSNCIKLKSVVVPSSVTQLIDGVFGGCSSLDNVTLNEGLLKIGAGAFASCQKLTTITIPYSVTTISGGSFSGGNLATINYCGSEEEWNSIEGLESAGISSEAKINYNYAG